MSLRATADVSFTFDYFYNRKFVSVDRNVE